MLTHANEFYQRVHGQGHSHSSFPSSAWERISRSSASRYSRPKIRSKCLIFETEYAYFMAGIVAGCLLTADARIANFLPRTEETLLPDAT
jgi:hypothetical protein